MGSILGGGSKGGGSSSSAINSSAEGVAKAAQAGGQSSAQAIQQAAQLGYDNTRIGSEWAADSALQGSQTSAAAQQQALDYLRQADSLPSGLREAALTSLGNLYNGAGSITDRAMASPLYKAAVQQGENSVLRNASATGGLRSGSTSENLAQVNQNALVSAYNDQIAGLQGLSSLPSNANTIAGYQAGIGNTLGQGQINRGNILGQGVISATNTYGQGQVSAADAIANGNNAAATAISQGQIAAANNKAQGSQNSANNMMGLANLGIQAWGMFSDRRLKSNIEFIGEENGLRKYRWVWNKLASALGLHGESHGVMADEVEDSHPDAVSIQDGYLIVNYEKLGVSHGV